ncbi:MAG: DUF1838 domain-containing protein [Steroidobacteraceae bacterium]|nr:DUF1838 domain-containing protein [Steroidobacteraceae bacterium]MDW8257871.1 DUF1838 family protein [Gammaproteobacteria bacterium]
MDNKGNAGCVANRRAFFETAGGVGAALALGAAGFATLHGGLAAAAPTRSRSASRYGIGPGLRGPYLDLTTGRGNQLAYARLQGDLDFGKQKYFWFKGYVMAVEPNKKIVDLLGAAGFGAIRLLPGPDGAIRRLCREIILYTDLKSGEVLDEWRNPLSGETVKVVHVANDPFNYLIEEHFPAPPKFGGLNEEAPPKVPFILPWYQHGDQLAMEVHIHLAYPSALQPDRWPRESAGPIAQVSEFFSHHVSVADMQNPKKTALYYHGSWNRITPWLPWMLMGMRPGHIQYACFQGTTHDLEQFLSKPVLDYAHRHYAKYFEAPAEWTDAPSLSSLENYAREQRPAHLRN